jgi:hypothetical protein
VTSGGYSLEKPSVNIHRRKAQLNTAAHMILKRKPSGTQFGAFVASDCLLPFSLPPLHSDRGSAHI